MTLEEWFDKAIEHTEKERDAEVAKLLALLEKNKAEHPSYSAVYEVYDIFITDIKTHPIGGPEADNRRIFAILLRLAERIDRLEATR